MTTITINKPGDFCDLRITRETPESEVALIVPEEIHSGLILIDPVYDWVKEGESYVALVPFGKDSLVSKIYIQNLYYGQDSIEFILKLKYPGDVIEEILVILKAGHGDISVETKDIGSLRTGQSGTTTISVKNNRDTDVVVSGFDSVLTGTLTFGETTTTTISGGDTKNIQVGFVVSGGWDNGVPVRVNYRYDGVDWVSYTILKGTWIPGEVDKLGALVKLLPVTTVSGNKVHEGLDVIPGDSMAVNVGDIQDSGYVVKFRVENNGTGDIEVLDFRVNGGAVAVKAPAKAVIEPDYSNVFRFDLSADPVPGINNVLLGFRVKSGDVEQDYKVVLVYAKNS